MWNKFREFSRRNYQWIIGLTIFFTIVITEPLWSHEISFANFSFTNIYADIIGIFDHQQAEQIRSNQPQQFYQTERPVNLAILSTPYSHDLSLNRSQLQKAAISLFHNLKKDQHYDTIIILPDPLIPVSDPDLFKDQAQHDFPEAQYFMINSINQDETSLLNQLNHLAGANSLIVLQSFLDQPSDQPYLTEIQQDFFKDIYDFPSKAGLLSLGYSNKEGIKAVYQYAKNQGLLKTLPTLKSEEHDYQIKYFTSGNSLPTQSATLTFFGDVMLGRFVRSLMDANTLDYPFQLMDQTYLQRNNLLIANLEGPIANQSVNTSKAIAFRFLPDVAPLLAKYHFDLLSTANNHTLDMGIQGYQDNHANLLQAGLTPFGDNRQFSEESISKQTINGLNFAFIGLNDTDFKVDRQQLLTSIRALAADNYLVIPFIHWGVEYQHTPSSDQIAFAHEMVDAGAATIIGMHPHVVQSLEIYNNKPIFYSLGNAIFDQYFSPDVQEGLSITMHFQPDQLEIYLLPIKINRSQFQLMNTDQKAEFFNRFVTYWRYDEDIKKQIEQGKIVININTTLTN